VDKADSTIKFHCENCGRKFSVPVVVPEIQTTSSAREQSNSEDTKTSSKSSAYDSALLDMPRKDKIQDLPLSQPENSEETAEYEQEIEEESAEKTETAQRKLPWPIDIFLYPLSISGLIHLVIFFCVPILLSLAYVFLLQHIWPVGELIIAILCMFYAGYVLYYLSWCVIDSTKGGLRAPDINFQPSPGKGELIECAGIFLACIVVCFWPTAVYYIFTRKTGLLYWLLTVAGLLFFPMALLAGSLHDSIHGLKPMLIIKSVIKTFLGYFPVVIFFAGFFAVLNIFIPPPQQSKGLEPILLYISQVTSAIFSSRNALRTTGFIYLAMTGAHILGRFYYKYQEKLNWEV
jgi:hypothetical protein